MPLKQFSSLSFLLFLNFYRIFSLHYSPSTLTFFLRKTVSSSNTLSLLSSISFARVSLLLLPHWTRGGILITHDPDEQTLSIRSKLALPDFFKDCCDFVVIEEVSSARLMQISRIFSYAHWVLDTIPENLEPRRLGKLICIYYTLYTIFCNEIQKYSFSLSSVTWYRTSIVFDKP